MKEQENVKLNPDRIALEVGKTIEGQFVERREKTNDKGETFKVIVFKNREGNLFTMREWAGLKIALDDANISAGDWIRIERKEDQETRNGNKMQSYDVYGANPQ